MSKLKRIREQRYLTQEELSAASGISVRTIQRIESGIVPKGKTLKLLAQALALNENDLLKHNDVGLEESNLDITFLKLINLSSLPFIMIPPLQIIVPLVIMFAKKEFNTITKQLISVQIVWLISAIIIFILSSFIKNWLALGSPFILIIMILLVLSNVFIILRNAAAIDKKQQLFFKLDFNLI